MREFWESYERIMIELWEIFEKDIRELWESFERVMRDLWEYSERVMRELWEYPERVMRDLWECFERVMRESWESYERYSCGCTISIFLQVCKAHFLCPCSAIIAFMPWGALQSIFGICTGLFLHWIVHFKEKRKIVLGVCCKKYFLAGVYGKFSCHSSALITFMPWGALQSIFWIWNWLFLH